jgi:hypothetical protein
MKGNNYSVPSTAYVTVLRYETKKYLSNNIYFRFHKFRFLCFDYTDSIAIRHADHVALSIGKKLELTSPTSGGCSVGILRPRTEATEIF